jgi:tetratricopeptide (TPR) repeat protein
LSHELQIQCEARGVVRFLVDRLVLQADVLAALQTDQSIREPVRKEALALAERYWDDPARLIKASWAIVSRPGASSGQYGRALRCAEAACRLQPEEGSLLTTLGVAQYRVGQFAEALQTLQRSAERQRTRFKSPFPTELAFLAMTCHRLGKRDQAQEYFDQLRQKLARPLWANDEQGKLFLREAEALVHGSDP